MFGQQEIIMDFEEEENALFLPSSFSAEIQDYEGHYCQPKYLNQLHLPEQELQILAFQKLNLSQAKTPSHLTLTKEQADAFSEKLYFRLLQYAEECQKVMLIRSSSMAVFERESYCYLADPELLQEFIEMSDILCGREIQELKENLQNFPNSALIFSSFIFKLMPKIRGEVLYILAAILTKIGRLQTQNKWLSFSEDISSICSEIASSILQQRLFHELVFGQSMDSCRKQFFQLIVDWALTLASLELKCWSSEELQIIINQFQATRLGDAYDFYP